MEARIVWNERQCILKSILLLQVLIHIQLNLLYKAMPLPQLNGQSSSSLLSLHIYHKIKNDSYPPSTQPH